jgi:hypothetical protein
VPFFARYRQELARVRASDVRSVLIARSEARLLALSLRCSTVDQRFYIAP